MSEPNRPPDADPTLWAVVLAGGIGSRFWPVSRPDRPKQLLPLAGGDPLIKETVQRIAPLVPGSHTLILTGENLAEPILQALPEMSRDNLLLEPQARGTAPVLIWAAHEIWRRDPGAVMISLHADHVIRPAEQFRRLLEEVARMAKLHHRLFTLGVSPTRPETGYGYIRVGPPLAADANAYHVSEFVEKPDRETATHYLETGEYLWNSGIFVWTPSLLLEEVRRHTPELARLLPLLENGDVAGFFRTAPRLSIDEGVLERSRRVAVARATFQWDDVGGWDNLGRARETDEAGNVRVGDTHLVDSSNCVAWSEAGPVVVFGGTDLVVVQANGVTFVAPRRRTAELKDLLRDLPEHLQRLED